MKKVRLSKLVKFPIFSLCICTDNSQKFEIARFHEQIRFLNGGIHET